jgi:hypothetical protein
VQIEEEAFQSTGLAAFVIPSSVKVLGFRRCYAVGSRFSAEFQPHSPLVQVEEGALYRSKFWVRAAFRGAGHFHQLHFKPGRGWSGLKIMLSVEMLGPGCFSDCKSLFSVTFQFKSRLAPIEAGAFRENGLSSIVIPSSVAILAHECFRNYARLRSVRYENGSLLRYIGLDVFGDSPVPPVCSLLTKRKVPLLVRPKVLVSVPAPRPVARSRYPNLKMADMLL